jgi:predicted glycosyltransferase
LPVYEGEKLKIWYDALTGKHLRYGVAISRRLRNLNHKIILTTRKHFDTLPLANFLNEKVTVVGQYNPRSLLSRTKESGRRQMIFCRLFERDLPDIAISHGSADQCRVAFGLGKPVISTIDTPYARAVHKLTLPLSNYIVASKAIPRKILRVYNTDAEVVTFNGVDEAAWIKDFKPTVKYDFDKPLIFVREYEEKATYAKEKVSLLSLAKEFAQFGNVVYLSRYKRKPIRGLTVPMEFIDSASLAAQADLVVGVGGTITREAALQGTPSIIIKVLPKQHVNDFLKSKGFPIYETEESGALKLGEKLLNRRYDVKHLLNRLENPVDIVAEIFSNISQD